MCTCFTHAIVGVAAGHGSFVTRMPTRFWFFAAACSAGPDLDAGLHAYGVRYEDVWGHRGMAHGLLFAAIVALIVVTLGFRKTFPPWTKMWWRLLAFFFLVTASHGLLDMLTDGGLGIALFSPIDTGRYFWPWQPLPVPNMGIGTLFTGYMGTVILTEFVFVAMPVVFVSVIVRWFRTRGQATEVVA